MNIPLAMYPSMDTFRRQASVPVVSACVIFSHQHLIRTDPIKQTRHIRPEDGSAELSFGCGGGSGVFSVVFGLYIQPECRISM